MECLIPKLISLFFKVEMRGKNHVGLVIGAGIIGYCQYFVGHLVVAHGLGYSHVAGIPGIKIPGSPYSSFIAATRTAPWGLVVLAESTNVPVPTAPLQILTSSVSFPPLSF